MQPPNAMQDHLCMFEVDPVGVGPFVGPQWAAFVPVEYYESSAPPPILLGKFY